MATAAATQTQELREALGAVPPSEIVSWINLLVYGDPGAGKTHLAGTAADSPHTSPVLVLDVDGGVTTLRHRQEIDVVTIRSERQLRDSYNKLYHSIKDGKIHYKTVVIDSLTELASLGMKDIMVVAYNKNPETVDIQVPSQREWGKSRENIREIVRAWRDLPCNVIYCAHAGTLQEEDQPTKYFPGFAGKLRTDIPGFMDIVGYLYPDNQQGVVTRYLQVQGSRRVVAKDRTSALGDVVENPTVPMLWDMIHSTNANTNNTKIETQNAEKGDK